MAIIENSEDRLKKMEQRFKQYDFPPNVLVEATAFCNINCMQCANSNLTRKKGFVDIKLYKKIVDEVAKENPEANFWLAFYGEPLLLKYKLYYMIQYAKKRGLKNTFVNTNGMLLTDEMSELLLEAGLDHIIIGIDGFSAEVFEKIRKHANRDTVYNNVINLNNKIRERGLSKPIIEVQFIEMEENAHEIEEYKEFWKKQNVNIKIRSRVSWSGHVEEGSNISHAIARIACGWATGTCPITWDGKMVACGTDCNAELIFGDVNDKSIKEIWNGARKEFVEHHLKHEFEQLPELCQNCSDWQVMGTVNLDKDGHRYEKQHK